MREALNPNTLFNTLAMVRQNSSALILVVEGEDDLFVLKEHHNASDVYLMLGHGRGDMLVAAGLADARRLGGVRFLIDSDHDQIVRSNEQHASSVICSTTHDVMMDLLVADMGNFDRMISTFVRGAERRGVVIDVPRVRDQAVGLAASVVPIRVVNEEQSMGLVLAEFPFGAVGTLPAELPELCMLTVKRSNTAHTVAFLQGEIERRPAHSLEEIHTVGDHDLFRSLARVLKEYKISVSSEMLFNAFLATITCVQIMRTRWFESIMNWGLANGRTIFTCPCAA